MRSLIAITVVAAGLAVAPAAGANQVWWDITPKGGSVRDDGWRDCDGCAPRPTELRLERGGATIAAAGPAVGNKIAIRPAPGDVARVRVDGVERAAVSWSGAYPSVDEACPPPGTSQVTGSFSPGEGPYGFSPFSVTATLFGGSSATAEATVSYMGSRYTAQFGRAIAVDDQIRVENFSHAYSSTDGGTFPMTVSITRPMCPSVVPEPVVPEPAAVTGPGRYRRVRVRRDSRFSLRATAVRCPGSGPACRVTISAAGPKRRALSRARRFGVEAGAERRLLVRLSRSGMRLLKRRGHLAARVSVAVTRGSEAPVKRVIAVRLLAPKPKR